MKITFAEAYSYHGIGHRDNQEDARFPDHDEVRADSYHSFVVCDGVGGSEKGEVASKLVAGTLGNELEQNLADEPLRVQDLAAALDACYDALAKNTTPRNLGMATTMTMISANLTGVTAAHIGDSRIYHIRPGVGILYRSEDHSLVNALVKAGVVKEEEAENHPQSNVITRCHAQWSRRQMSVDTILTTARSLNGVTYLWGGTTPKALDCSGFTQVCFRNTGTLLPRNASAQAKIGENVAVDKPEQWEAGDLLFFGPDPDTTRITHVGIYLGNGRYIHCSGMVMTSSINPTDPLFLARRVLAVRRINRGFSRIATHGWYF